MNSLISKLKGQRIIKDWLEERLSKYNIHKFHLYRLGRDLLNLAKPIIDQPLHLLNLMEFDFENPPYLYESPLIGDNAQKTILGGSKFIPIDSFMPDDAFVIASKDH